MQRLEVSGAVRHIYGSLGVKRLIALLFRQPWHWMGFGDQRHASAALTPVKRSGAHYIGGWVGSRNGLGGYGISRPHPDSIPGQFIP